jgi:hypothetical protein
MISCGNCGEVIPLDQLEAHLLTHADQLLSGEERVRRMMLMDKLDEAVRMGLVVERWREGDPEPSYRATIPMSVHAILERL